MHCSKRGTSPLTPTYLVYLRRYQERGLMQKPRCLMDEKSVSFQMFLILLSFITLGSESHFFFLCSSDFEAILRCLGGGWGGKGGGMRRSQNLALCSVQFLASFISFYFEILSYLACGEKIIRLASKIAWNWAKNQLVISSLSDMLQETLFLLTRYICMSFVASNIVIK